MTGSLRINKQKRRGIFQAVLVSVLILALVFSLAACCKDKTDKNKVARDNAAASIVSAVLSGRNSAWTKGMSDAQISGLAECGDYVVTQVWAEYVADFLKGTSLPTAQLEDIASTLKSAEGKAFLADPRANIGNLFSLLKSSGLIPGDIEEIVYNGLLAFVDKAIAVYDECALRLTRLQTGYIQSISGTAKDNLNAALTGATNSSAALTASGLTAAATKDAVRNAESSIKSIASFAYQSALMFGGDGLGGLLNDISSGALAGASDNDIATYFSSIVASVKELKNTLTASQLSALSSAITALENVFNSVTITNSTMQSISTALRYLYMFSDHLPVICDFIIDGSEALFAKDTGGNYSFIADLKLILSQEEKNDYNPVILSARAFLSIMKNGNEQDAKDYISGLAAAQTSDYRKTMTMFFVCFLFNGVHQEEVWYQPIFNTVMGELALAVFKNAYYLYVASPSSKTEANLSTWANSLIRYLDKADTMTAAQAKTREGYEYFISVVEQKLKTETAANASVVYNDIQNLITKLFSDESMDSLRALAALPMFASNDEDTTQFEELLVNSGFDKVYGAFFMIVTMLGA